MAKPKHFQRLAKRYPEYVSAVEKLGAAVVFSRSVFGILGLRWCLGGFLAKYLDDGEERAGWMNFSNRLAHLGQVEDFQPQVPAPQIELIAPNGPIGLGTQ